MLSVSRRRTLLLIHLYLAIQLLAPAGYYLWRFDRYDERFAWRMFSSVRQSQCGAIGNFRAPPQFILDGQTVPLESEFHEAWVNLARRARPDVLVAIGERLCARHPGASVFLRYECRDLHGKIERFVPGTSNLCEGLP